MATRCGASARNGARNQRGGNKVSATSTESRTALFEFDFACPICGRANRARYKRSNDGDMRWFIVCFSCDSRGLSKGEYLRAVAQEVNAPNGWEIKNDPLRWLDDYAAVPARGVVPERLPSQRLVRRWHLRLRERRDVLAYLRNERGIRLATASKYRLGYDGEAITIPVYANGELVNVKRRYWPHFWKLDDNGKQIWKRALSHRPSKFWYPDVPDGGKALLVAGELDALLLRQNGFASAVSTTNGALLPIELAPGLAGKLVAIMFDVGEEAQAQLAADNLWQVGAKPFIVPLGLRDAGNDPTQWFMKYHRSAHRLRRRIQRYRPTSPTSLAHAKRGGSGGGR